MAVSGTGSVNCPVYTYILQQVRQYSQTASYRVSSSQISVKALSLNRKFSEIAAQLNAIIEERFLDRQAI